MRKFRLRNLTLFAPSRTAREWRHGNTISGPIFTKLHQIFLSPLILPVFKCHHLLLLHSPRVSSPTSPFPASSLNSTTGGPCGSGMCQVAAPPLILLNQANTPTQNHKIKSQILADVQQSFSSHSNLPYDPGLIVLTLISPVLNALLTLHLSYTPG